MREVLERRKLRMRIAAVVLAVVGAFLSPWLMVIAVLVWLGATLEAAETETRSVLGGVAVKEAMITDFRSLDVLDPPERAVSAILSGSQRDFPVLHGEHLVGVLSQQDLLSAMASAEAPVMHLGQIIRRDMVTFAPGEPLGEAVPRLMNLSQGCYPVMQDGRILGLLTIDNVLEFVAFRRALQQREAVAA